MQVYGIVDSDNKPATHRREGEEKQPRGLILDHFQVISIHSLPNTMADRYTAGTAPVKAE